MDKYHCDKEDLHDTLKKYGVAIIRNVLDKKEIEHGIDEMWKYLEKVSSNFDVPITRKDQKTWKHVKDLLPTRGMVVQHHQIGHSQFVWDVRQNEKVVDVFSHLWGVPQEKLICSFDGASILMPHEITGVGQYRGKEWYHLDQSPMRNKFECVQSWVTLYDVNEGDATLSIFEGSHKYHKDFAERFDLQNKKDWFLLDQIHYEFYLKEKRCKKINITCPAGSMVLWDSRTVHMGMQSLKTRAKKNFRCVVYICMSPRELCDDKNLRKKRNAFEEKRMTSHWPHKVILFSKNAGNRWNKMVQPVTEIEDPVLNNIGYSLAGF